MFWAPELAEFPHQMAPSQPSGMASGMASAKRQAISVWNEGGWEKGSGFLAKNLWSALLKLSHSRAELQEISEF